MGQGAYIFGCEATRLSQAEKALFSRTQPFGFILFARNIDTPRQLLSLTSELRDCIGRDAPIFIDQEGGRVDRMNGDHWPASLPALDQVDLSGAKAERSMWLRARLIAADLYGMGIDVNCVPLCDIVMPHTHPVLKNRCYGRDADTVTRIARSVADATLAGGVLPVVKHIPGYGRAGNDAHLQISVVDAPEPDLQVLDFAPFRALADLPMAMTAHLIYSALDDQPATQSHVIMGMIRGDIGFEGLLISDDISMEALEGGLAMRSKASLDAGCDIVLHCNGELAEMRELADIAGMMNPQTQTRADQALAWRRQPEPFDAEQARAELNDIMVGAAGD